MTDAHEPLRIGDVAERAEVSVATIRYYEARGLLPTARREGGRRCYGESAVVRLDVIRALKAAGFSLDDIRRLLVDDAATFAQTRHDLVTTRLEDVRRTIAGLQAVERALQMAVECGCISLEHCERVLAIASTRCLGR